MAAIGLDPLTEELSVVEEAGSVPGKKEVPYTFDITRISSTELPPNGGWCAWSQVLGT